MNTQDLKQFEEILDRKLDEKLDKKFDEKLKGFAKKDDFKNFPTKDDLKNFPTKDDLKNFPTKDDLHRELSRYATKDDYKNLEKRLVDKIDDAAALIIQTVDKTKADRQDVIALEKRVKIIEDDLDIPTTH